MLKSKDVAVAILNASVHNTGYEEFDSLKDVDENRGSCGSPR